MCTRREVTPRDEDRAGAVGTAGRLGRQLRVVAQDRLLEPDELDPRLHAEGVDQRGPGLAVDLERLDLPARAIEGEHEQLPEPLAQRLRRGELRQLPDHVGVTPERELRLESPLQRPQPQLVEPRDGALGERLSGQVGQRVPAPEPEGLVERGDRLRGLGLVRPRAQRLEAPQVERLGPDVDDVSGRPGLDRRLAERPPQLGDLAVNLRHRGRRGVAGVELVRDAVDRDHPTGVEQQQREDRALDAPPERDLLAVAARLEWAEDAERDHGGTVAAR